MLNRREGGCVNIDLGHVHSALYDQLLETYQWYFSTLWLPCC